MADKVAKDQQYQYALNSNLVLHANRSDRRGNEPTGEAESLYGRIDPKEFGSRATRDLSKVEEAKKKKTQPSEKDVERRKKRAEEKSLKSAYGYSSVLAATEDLESGGYRPRTKETRQTYELILTFVQRYLGDVSHDVVRSAGDTVLEILHTDTLKDFDKKKEIEEILGRVMESDQFSVLINLGKKITDYNPASEEMSVDQDGELKNVGDIDEQYGVAVVFDEEEEEEDIYSLHSESEHEDEEGLDTAQDVVIGAGKADQEEESKMEVDDDEAVRVGASESKVDTTKKLQPHQVDAYWLQRFISTFYKDEIVAQEKTDEAMNIIASESINMRDCENELMALFDYDKFELVSMLTRNRDVIVWCTRLGKANEQERAEIESKMKELGLDWIIKGMGNQTGAKSDLRRRKAGQAPAAAGPMAVLPKEKGPAPATAAPRQLLDLEAMSFAQGSHLMSNKSVHVPEGSFRRQKKGYEEVHVPQPKKPSSDRPLVHGSALPEWIQGCFPKKGLNPI
ncbi:DEIH-box ATPase, partial [Entomortierella beljakovae]